MLQANIQFLYFEGRYVFAAWRKEACAAIEPFEFVSDELPFSSCPAAKRLAHMPSENPSL